MMTSLIKIYQPAGIIDKSILQESTEDEENANT